MVVDLNPGASKVFSLAKSLLNMPTLLPLLYNTIMYLRNVFWAFKKRKRQTWRIPEVQTRARTASPFQSSRWREGSGASLFRTEKNRVVKTAYSCLCRTGLWLPIKPEPEKVWSKWNLIIKGVERKILLSNGPKRTTWLIVETEISLTTISKILQDNNGLQFFYSIASPHIFIEKSECCISLRDLN